MSQQSETQQFILVQRGAKVELIQGIVQMDVKRGDIIDRMPPPATESEDWFVVKVFHHDQQRILEAIYTLIGPDRLRGLFQTMVSGE